MATRIIVHLNFALQGEDKAIRYNGDTKVNYDFAKYEMKQLINSMMDFIKSEVKTDNRRIILPDVLLTVILLEVMFQRTEGKKHWKLKTWIEVLREFTEHERQEMMNEMFVQVRYLMEHLETWAKQPGQAERRIMEADEKRIILPGSNGPITGG